MHTNTGHLDLPHAGRGENRSLAKHSLCGEGGLLAPPQPHLSSQALFPMHPLPTGGPSMLLFAALQGMPSSAWAVGQVHQPGL